jgi:tRNA pseudouridine55 synthase
MYSAVKVKGKKLYELARKGIEVERAPREVVVYGIDLLGGDPENKEYEIRVKCSKGTYIRTLCHDIGRALGVGAVMTSLLREKSGGFDVGDAVTLSGLERLSAAQEAEKALIPLSALFPELPAVVLPEGEERLVKNGVSVAYPGAPPAGGGKRVKVFSHAGEFLMLAFQADGKNGQPLLKMEKSFY